MKRHILINNMEEIEDGMTTLLINTDSARLHTGFANCGRVMADHLYEAVDKNGDAKYNISYLGWYDNPRSQINRPYKMYKTITNPAINDKWGQITLPTVIEKEKPDIVISIGDTWMVYHVNKTRGRDTFKHVFYMPADGEPIPREMLIKGGGKIDWRQNVLDTDYIISYCPFGTRVIDNMVGQKTVYRDIPFGVYTTLTRKPSGRRHSPTYQRTLSSLGSSQGTSQGRLLIALSMLCLYSSINTRHQTDQCISTSTVLWMTTAGGTSLN